MYFKEKGMIFNILGACMYELTAKNIHRPFPSVLSEFTISCVILYKWNSTDLLHKIHFMAKVNVLLWLINIQLNSRITCLLCQ